MPATPSRPRCSARSPRRPPTASPARQSPRTCASSSTPTSLHSTTSWPARRSTTPSTAGPCSGSTAARRTPCATSCLRASSATRARRAPTAVTRMAPRTWPRPRPWSSRPIWSALRSLSGARPAAPPGGYPLLHERTQLDRLQSHRAHHHGPPVLPDDRQRRHQAPDGVRRLGRPSTSRSRPRSSTCWLSSGRPRPLVHLRGPRPERRPPRLRPDRGHVPGQAGRALAG
jgi:hypothetical protein